MTLSPTTKKNLHAGIVAVLSGGLSYLTGALSTGRLPNPKDLVIGCAVGAGSRLAGWLLNLVETS